MARYENCIQKASGAAAGAVVSLRAASASRDVRVFEIGISVVTAVAGEIGIGRPANSPVATTSTAAGAPLDNVSGAGASLIDSAWSTAPTAPTVPWRRFQFPATIGAGVIWTFPNGIVVPASGNLVVWQFSALAVTYDVYLSYDE